MISSHSVSTPVRIWSAQRPRFVSVQIGDHVGSVDVVAHRPPPRSSSTSWWCPAPPQRLQGRRVEDGGQVHVAQMVGGGGRGGDLLVAQRRPGAAVRCRHSSTFPQSSRSSRCGRFAAPGATPPACPRGTAGTVRLGWRCWWWSYPTLRRWRVLVKARLRRLWAGWPQVVVVGHVTWHRASASVSVRRRLRSV